MAPYAYECVACGHLLSRHGLVDYVPLDGPYRCQDCGHDWMRGDDERPLSRDQYQAKYGATS